MEEKLQDFRAEFKKQKADGQASKTTSRSRILALAGALAVILAVLAVLFFLVLGVAKVQGNSMVPTYHSGDTVWFVRSTRNIRRGTVVSVKMPAGDHYIKRVVALPGDTVDIRDGQLIVNGEAVEEPYAAGETERDKNGIMIYPYQLPENKYFVLGDNRTRSEDSRSFGPISVSQIRGVILGQS